VKNNQLNHFTDNCVLLLSMLAQAVSFLSCIWCHFLIQTRTSTVLTEGSYGFSQSLQANCGIVAQGIEQLLMFISFPPILYSLLSFRQRCIFWVTLRVVRYTQKFFSITDTKSNNNNNNNNNLLSSCNYVTELLIVFCKLLLSITFRLQSRFLTMCWYSVCVWTCSTTECLCTLPEQMFCVQFMNSVFLYFFWATVKLNCLHFLDNHVFFYIFWITMYFCTFLDSSVFVYIFWITMMLV